MSARNGPGDSNAGPVAGDRRTAEHLTGQLQSTTADRQDAEWHAVAAPVMTRTERDDLAKVARLRAKVARTAVAQREAELLADVEAQLAAEYDFADETWAEITKGAAEAVADADQQVAALCRARGIPEDFRPSLSVTWYGRGRNAVAGRRVELRKVAQTRIAAAAKGAKAAIEASEAEVLTELLAGGLTSDAARAFLESIPSAKALMPPMHVRELEGGGR